MRTSILARSASCGPKPRRSFIAKLAALVVGAVVSPALVGVRNALAAREIAIGPLGNDGADAVDIFSRGTVTQLFRYDQGFNGELSVQCEYGWVDGRWTLLKCVKTPGCKESIFEMWG